MDFSAIKGVTLPGNLEVKKMQHGNDVLWEAAGGEDYSRMPFFVQNETGTDGTIRMSAIPMAPSFDIYTSTDNENWVNSGSTGHELLITLPANGRAYFRANTGGWCSSSFYNYFSSSTVYFSVGGNIMSLLYGADYESHSTYSQNRTFYGLFYDNARLVDASNLVLPDTVTNYCYYGMFSGCTSLTTAPELPATTLTSNCYQYMFRNCTSLNYIKAMFTTTPGSSYTNNWVSGVAASGTFVKNASATWDVSGNDGIPSGWTVQTASE